MYSSGLGWMRTARVDLQQCGIPVYIFWIDVGSGGCFARVVTETGEVHSEKASRLCSRSSARQSLSDQSKPHEGLTASRASHASHASHTSQSSIGGVSLSA